LFASELWNDFSACDWQTFRCTHEPRFKHPATWQATYKPWVSPRGCVAGAHQQVCRQKLDDRIYLSSKSEGGGPTTMSSAIAKSRHRLAISTVISNEIGFTLCPATLRIRRTRSRFRRVAGPMIFKKYSVTEQRRQCAGAQRLCQMNRP
jgi:hypothetical protein